jgi:hypothetical protein
MYGYCAEAAALSFQMLTMYVLANVPRIRMCLDTVDQASY